MVHGGPAVAAPPRGTRVSVIVTAHGRREFLLEAVRSARAAADASIELELWVVKDFADPAIDAELDALGAHHLETTAGPLGAKLALGIARAGGEILAFLEDDDAYEPGRLGRVADRFRSVPGLGYYRNGQRRVGPGGEQLDGAAAGRAESNLRRFGVVAGGPQDLDTLLPRLVRIDPDFNLSSIAIRREVVGDRLDELEQLTAAVDSFVFYSALEHRTGVWIESEPLTRYRVHPSNVSLWQTGDAPAAAARAIYQRNFLDAFGRTYARLRTRGPRAAAQLAGSAYYGTWILYRLLTGEGGRRALAQELRRYWRESPWTAIRYRWDLSIWGLAALFAPTWARRRFIRRRQREAVPAST